MPRRFWGAGDLRPDVLSQWEAASSVAGAGGQAGGALGLPTP